MQQQRPQDERVRLALVEREQPIGDAPIVEAPLLHAHRRVGVGAVLAARVDRRARGGIVEVGPVADVIHRPSHPYTVGLMGSIPAMDEDRERLLQIDGAMPRLNAIPSGCAFNPRCPHAFDRCRAERPNLIDAGPTHAACWLVAEGQRRAA